MVFAATTAFGASSINWQTDYSKAVQQAKSESKPILLFFTGSDWCGWCKKLDNEVFKSPEFRQSNGRQDDLCRISTSPCLQTKVRK